MYIDGVILFGVLIVVLTCAVVIYLGVYSWQHFKQDSLKSQQESNPSIVKQLDR